jgi:hypothetical protein
LRDRFLSELSSLASADEATAWAQRALGAKNTMGDGDATLVEAAFASRMTELGEDGEAPSPSGQQLPAAPPGRVALMAALQASVELGVTKDAALPAHRNRGKRRAQAPSALPQPSAPSASEVESVNSAVLSRVDESALMLGEPRRYRDRAHLEFVCRNRASSAEDGRRMLTTCASCSRAHWAAGSAMNSQSRSAAPTIVPFTGTETKLHGGPLSILTTFGRRFTGWKG